VTVSVEDSDGTPQESVHVFAFDGSTYTGVHGVTDGSGTVGLGLPDGSYRFRADLNGVQFWSDETNHCTVPDCTSAQVTVTKPVEVTVVDTNGAAVEGLNVYAFDGATYTGVSGTTDANGAISFTLPVGDFRFRADRNGTQFWSGEANHCALPGCEAVSITVSKQVSVSVQDTDGLAQEGLKVYAFDGPTYTGFNATTDSTGIVTFTLPLGHYRFRADLNGSQFWSDEANHCTIPGCESTTIIVTKPVTVTVQDTDTVPAEGLEVYAFDGSEYTGFHGTTDANGAVNFTLPQGDYRFRADLNGTQFWSGETNHCTVPGCESAGVTVTKPVLATVASELGDPYPELPVYVFDGDTYTGFSGTSDADGRVNFTLPQGDYRFRSDYDGVQFWSNSPNHCAVPGCEAAAVEIPGGFGSTTTTIDYTYDPLYRLTAADYSSGEYFHYTYDAVGNRLTEETHEGSNTYSYDIANRLISVDGVDYIWDDKGNLLSDGTSVYEYDHANRLEQVTQGTDVYVFGYNGLGDRLQQIVNGAPTGYTLDINRGLTQVLADGDNTYLYGLNRIGEEQPSGWQYHLPDALGSVRQLIDPVGVPTRLQSFEPFGSSSFSAGSASTAYGFTGEQVDASSLVYLRARYLNPGEGRFITRDPEFGTVWIPTTLNRWAYAQLNPIRITDPSGRCLDLDGDGVCDYPQEVEGERQLDGALSRIDAQTREYLSDHICGYCVDEECILNNMARRLLRSGLSRAFGYFPSSLLSVSNRGLEFITKQEGIRLNLYDDQGPGVGHCTIGVGHLVHHGPCDRRSSESEFLGGISRSEALRILRADLDVVEVGLEQTVLVPLKQNQFDALASFVFNIGIPAFSGSSALAALNKGRYGEVPNEFLPWIFSQGEPLKALVRRRQREAALFEFGVYK
jgi:RHS repeat-associated protein